MSDYVSELEKVEAFRKEHPNEGLIFKNLKNFPVHFRPHRNNATAHFSLAGNKTIEAHVSELGPGGSSSKHRHMDEAIIYIVTGRGYSTVQNEGEEEIRLDWEEGDLFSPPLNAWHQHFNTDPEKAARYLAITNMGLMGSLGILTVESHKRKD